MIKGFLFDYDGVMTKNNNANTPPSERLANVLGMPSKEVGDLFMTLWPNYLRGKLTDEALWDFLEDKTGKLIPMSQRDIWSKWADLQPLPEMLELVTSLRQDGYPVGLLTNVTPTTLEEVREGGGYEGFDFLVQSCKVGYAKPDPEIYDLALTKFSGFTPDQVLFIDDREHCLVPARAMGMHAILSVTSREVIADIHHLLAVENHTPSA